MLRLVESNHAAINEIHRENRASATNLLHYLALRRHDIRRLQEQLAELGLSSLGRTEAHVLGAVRAVMGVLGSLDGMRRVASTDAGDCGRPDCGRKEGQQFLERNTEALLGAPPENRRVRIMVTMPSEAATNYSLIRDLLAGGMNCMRINCAHDNPAAWDAMIRNLRKAETETGKRCKIEMDIAGPKLRTGSIEPGPAVLKVRPKRDAFGKVTEPSRIWLTPHAHPEPPPEPADACVSISGSWLERLEPGDLIHFVDARGAKRVIGVRERIGKSWWAESTKTAYLVPRLVFAVHSRAKGHPTRRARVGEIPPKPQSLQLRSGDTLILTRSLEPGQPAECNAKGETIDPARIGVTLPEFFDYVRPGHRIWLDDGKFSAVVRKVEPDEATVEIQQAPPGGAKLGAEKGVNAPETDLRIPALTDEDLQHLPFIVNHADLLGYSFVRTEEDVRLLQTKLAELGAEHLGIVLKVETRRGFENLPRLLLAAMRSRNVGVMIARGDLAVECGYQRLAEAQEEILWISEAAHLPVIWATQVLESLAKTGMPSRSEITDAAMGERAECVMLNKGPYMVDAVTTLDDILRRMQAHQEKKRSMLRKLRVAAGFAADSGAVPAAEAASVGRKGEEQNAVSHL